MPEAKREIWNLDKDPLSASEVEKGLGLLKDKGTKDAKAYDTKPLDVKSLETTRLDSDPPENSPEGYKTTRLEKSVADMAAEDLESVEGWQFFARNGLVLSAELANFQKRLELAETFDEFTKIIREMPRGAQTRVINDYSKWIKDKRKNSR